MPTILPFQAENLTLASVGGKGLNLARLAQAGFPVPNGFLITTEAYRAFVEANGLQAVIDRALAAVDAGNPDSLQQASQTIRDRFETGAIPTELARELIQSYVKLGRGPVAVRSSATAEDLPDLSFAGQQDTYLNVVGEAALLEAVKKAWASLWTARAIGYRLRNRIPHEGLALAVVVQAMVESEASGVLFTANPVTGKRTEMVIDATLGLGEALVSGRVEPDHYVVDVTNHRILEKRLGGKRVVIHSKKGGGVEERPVDASERQAIPDAVILELVALGRDVTAFYEGQPQDIEWAWAEGRVYLLQSRPITSLYPLPANMPAEPLRVMVALSEVQGVMDPITKMGQDGLILFFCAMARLFSSHIAPENQSFVCVAGERIYLDVTGLFRHPQGRRLLLAAAHWVMPDVREGLQRLADDPRLATQPAHIPWARLPRLLLLAARVLLGFARALARPDARREAVLAHLEKQLALVENELHPQAAASQQVERIQRLFFTLAPDIFPRLLPLIAGGMSMLNALMRLARTTPEGESLALEITRGLPHNVTTEMDLALWETAQRIRADETATAMFAQESATALAQRYLQGALPRVAQQAAADFLKRYGMRGFGEIDLGRARWRENPAPVMQSIQNYLRIEDPDQAPDVVFARGAQAAEAAVERLAAYLREQGGLRGRFKARLARFAARQVRALAGQRETPKFFIIRAMGMAREALLASARPWVEAGALDELADVAMLHLREWREIEAGREMREEIRARWEVYRREQRRRQIPKLLLSDGEAIYEGAFEAGEDAAMLRGAAVSPGVVEGRARIVFDPHDAHLQPGDILVCPGTDPSWTPLFLAAGGLVTEVGGMMTHGSVVAREYGIPAVVGVRHATRRLKDGQRVRVNGSTGVVRILVQG